MAADVTSVSPQRGRPGETLTITGTGFAAANNSVTFDGAPAAVTSESTTEVQVTVPAGLDEDYQAEVIVTNDDDATSDTFWWLVERDPADARSLLLPAKQPGTAEDPDGVRDAGVASSRDWEELHDLVEQARERGGDIAGEATGAPLRVATRALARSAYSVGEVLHLPGSLAELTATRAGGVASIGSSGVLKGAEVAEVAFQDATADLAGFAVAMVDVGDQGLESGAIFGARQRPLLRALVAFDVEAAEDARYFIGFTDQTQATMIGADEPASGTFIGFSWRASTDSFVHFLHRGADGVSRVAVPGMPTSLPHRQAVELVVDWLDPEAPRLEVWDALTGELLGVRIAPAGLVPTSNALKLAILLDTLGGAVSLDIYTIALRLRPGGRH